MGRYVPKTYRNFHAVRVILKLFLFLILAVVVLFISLFFGLRKYAVYTSDGVRLEIPFLMEEAPEETE